MIRGFIGGALAGGALGLGVATVATVLAPPPQSPEVSDAAPGGGEAPAVVASVDRGAQTAEPLNTAPDATGESVVAAPEADTLTALDGDITAPGGVPQTGDAGALVAPEQAADAGTVTTVGDDPVLPNPLALAPMAPQPADELSISTEPAQPPMPAPDAEGSAFAEAAPVAPEEEAAVAAPVEVSEAPEADDAPTDVIQDAPSVEDPVVQPETETVAIDKEAPGPEEETAEAVTPEAETETAVEPEVAEAETNAPQVASEEEPLATEEAATPEDVATASEEAETPPATQPEETEPEETEPKVAEATPAEPEPAPEAAPVSEPEEAEVAMVAPATRPQIGTPAVSLTDRSSGIAVRRPGAQEDAPTAEEAPSPEATDTESISGDPRPIAQFAQGFDNPDAKPLMGIVLIDDGASPTSGAAGIAALRSFPYTLSFAIDTSLPDAAERMALYRREGFEVLAMIDLPQGAQASDVETTLNATLSQLPEVLGVLEGPDTGVQETRETSDQVTAILAQTGHGLVTQSRGLNTMPKLARKEGVPATPIFRDFDGKGQTPVVMRRFLDQAAFKAGQEGAVIMLGRLRPDTITALLLWGLQDRAGQVALAPISAILLSEDG